MYCWYCYHGWPKQVADIYDEAKKRGASWSVLHFGPAHIVWEDENFNYDSVQWCLDNFNKYSEDLTEQEAQAVRWSLEELMKLPENILDPAREYHDVEDNDKHPKDYPPPEGMIMVKQ